MEARNQYRCTILMVACIACYQRKISKPPDSLVLHIWSNGCTGQFILRFVFSLLSQFAINHTLFWYYNEQHHGKGPMDGIGGTNKHRVFRDVKSKKVSIKNAEHLVLLKSSLKFNKKLMNLLTIIFTCSLFTSYFTTDL